MSATPVSATSEPVDDPQLHAERSLFRSIFIGMAIGAVVCCGIWAVMVTIASSMADLDTFPLLWVGLVCGLAAGLFLGGSMGALFGAIKLEHVHHESLRRPS